MKLWDILVDLPFSEFSFVSHEVSNYYFAFIKIVMHLVNITIQWKMAWIAKLGIYQFLLYKNFTHKIKFYVWILNELRQI